MKETFQYVLYLVGSVTRPSNLKDKRNSIERTTLEGLLLRRRPPKFSKAIGMQIRER